MIEAERKRQIFLDCHFDDIGHHLGQKKTVHRIQSKYYWLGIIKDVVDWVRTVHYDMPGAVLASVGRDNNNLCDNRFRLKYVRHASTLRGVKTWQGLCDP